MLRVNHKKKILSQLTRNPTYTPSDYTQSIKPKDKDMGDKDMGDKDIGYINEAIIGLNDGIKRITKCTYMGEEYLDAAMPSQGIAKLVSYSINLSAIQPFLLFDMANGETEVALPIVDLSSSSWKALIKSSDNIYQGYYIFKGETYVFIQVKQNTDVKLFSSRDERISCSVDDICNLGKVYNITVNKHTKQFFIHNDQFIRLIDPDGDLIDTPVSAYFGSYWKRIAVTAALGPFVMAPYASFGPYYYYSDYERALRFSVLDWTKRKIGSSKSLIITRDDTNIFTKGGVVKFVLFLGRSKVFLNRKSDPEDDSEYTIDKANRSVFIENTMKIRDNDGKWTKEYDSVISTAYPDFKINNIESLDPQIVLKKYSQHSSVSYVYIDTSNVHKSSDGLDKYSYDEARIM